MKNYFNLHEEINSLRIYGTDKVEQVDLTIVIPTYKREMLLKATIESILRQKKVHLTYNVLIVSNDEKFDINSLELELPPHIFSVYINEKNLGMVGNMNRCATLAKGCYVSYLQDDDLLMDNYLQEIEQVINGNEMDDIDCLIPNRYYYYDRNNKESNFGEKAYVKERVKATIKKCISFGVKKELYQQVTARDCALTWYNCFGGGPTCGILFKREALLNSSGFNEEYPFAFDFVFFIDFSEKHKVVLYDKYLSIYRMSASASNRPDVQADFYKSDIYLLNYTLDKVWFVKCFRTEIERFSYENKSMETQKLLGEKARLSWIKKSKYVFYRIVRFVILMRSNLYRKQITPEWVVRFL